MSHNPACSVLHPSLGPPAGAGLGPLRVLRPQELPGLLVGHVGAAALLRGTWAGVKPMQGGRGSAAGSPALGAYLCNADVPVPAT